MVRVDVEVGSAAHAAELVFEVVSPDDKVVADLCPRCAAQLDAPARATLHPCDGIEQFVHVRVVEKVEVETAAEMAEVAKGVGMELEEMVYTACEGQVHLNSAPE